MLPSRALRNQVVHNGIYAVGPVLYEYSPLENEPEYGEIYSIQTNCFYKSYKFQVISEKEDSILIYTPNYEVGTELNMEFIERSVFHKWIKKNAVDRIVEEKTLVDL